MATENLELIDNTVALKGEITFYNAPALCAQLLQILPKDKSFIVDLKHITTCDSASMVVLLQIVGFATEHQQKVKFASMPKSMRVLSELYALNPIFRLKNYPDD